MNALEAISKRKSVRVFSKKTVGEKTVEKILEAARMAPSAKNMQPLEYIRIEDEAYKATLAHLCRQKQPLDAPVVIAVIGDKKVAGLVGNISTHDITTSQKGQNIFLYMDGAAAIQNMLIAATALGIDSLWISSFDEKNLAWLLNLEEHQIPLAVVCFGYRGSEPFSPPKNPLVIHYNRRKEIKRNMGYLETCRKINELGGEFN